MTNMALMETKEELVFKKQVFLIAGYSGIIIAIVYAFISIAFAISGFPLPAEASQWVTYLEGKTSIWWSIIWLSIITNILYLPFTYGLYEFLKRNYKALMMIVGLLFTLFVFLELAITWINYPTIIELFQKYKLASSETQKQIILSAIEFASTSFQTPVTAFYTIVIPSLAVILASYVMLKSKEFGKVISWIGLVSGICNIISVLGGYFGTEFLEALVIPGSFLSIFWFTGIGVHFIKLSKKEKKY